MNTRGTQNPYDIKQILYHQVRELCIINILFRQKNGIINEYLQT